MKPIPRIQKLLKPKEALLLSSYSNILYLTQLPIFSREEKEAYILLTNKNSFIVTDKRYTEELSGKLKDFQIIERGSLYFLSQDLKQFCEDKDIRTLYFEKEDLSLNEYNFIKRSVNAKPFKDDQLRLFKEDWEIRNIKRAAKLADGTFSYALSKLKTGISEKELALEIEFYIRGKGHDISFKPIVAFGKNSSIPHHLPNATKLKKNQIVLLDLGARVNNYCSDLTRTVFYGKADPEFIKIHEIVHTAQRNAFSYLKTAKRVGGKELDKVARDYIESKGYEGAFTHSLGHGVGVEVHEYPRLSPLSKNPLSEGMVFSIEPGIYLKNKGGVRIEDLVVLTKKGPELISKSNRGIIEV